MFVQGSLGQRKGIYTALNKLQQQSYKKPIVWDGLQPISLR